jgi:hypothetical protein
MELPVFELIVDFNTLEPHTVNNHHGSATAMNDFYSPYPNSNFSNYQQHPSSSSYNTPYSEQQASHDTSNQPKTSILQSQLPSIWNPAVTATLSAASGNPNMLMDMGLKAGQTFLDQGTARMIPGLEKTMRYLRVYFAVNNSYVQRKMNRVLFSFFFRNWKRLVRLMIQSPSNHAFFKHNHTIIYVYRSPI